MLPRVSNVYQAIRARQFAGAASPMVFIPCRALNLSWLLLIASLWSASVGAAGAASISLNPAQDTFISEYVPRAGPNGTDVDMVIGTQGANVGFTRNRGLIQFDLSAILAGAVVTSVTLRLTVTSIPLAPASSNFELHRLVQGWDDLESTWSLRLDPDENWAVPGGQGGADFSATSSGRVRVSGLGDYTFASTPELIADVNAWLANPATNHGWLVKTENESVGFMARRFASREGSSGAPVLEVRFEVPQPPRISSAEITAGHFCLLFTACQGKSYVVERRDLVDRGEWTTITNLPPMDVTGEATVCDPMGTGTGFYRVGER